MLYPNLHINPHFMLRPAIATGQLGGNQQILAQCVDAHQAWLWFHSFFMRQKEGARMTCGSWCYVSYCHAVVCDSPVTNRSVLMTALLARPSAAASLSSSDDPSSLPEVSALLLSSCNCTYLQPVVSDSAHNTLHAGSTRVVCWAKQDSTGDHATSYDCCDVICK